MQDFSLYDRVRVHVGNSTSREGEVIYKGDTYFTVKFKNYPEAFQYFELKTGNVRMEILK